MSGDFTRRFRYSAWDDTQRPFNLDARDILKAITDDVLDSGDVLNALRHLLHEGMEDADGNRIQGLRELMERARAKRRDLLERHDLGGVFSGIDEALRDVIETEHRALDALAQSAHESHDERRIELVDDTVTQRRLHLDLLPHDLAGKVKELTNYDFVSSDAAHAFDELVTGLRKQLMEQQISRALGEMAAITPEDIARQKDMLAELNRMLDDRANGRTPDFAGFMERYGDLFPENPKDLDALLSILAQRMAAMQAMFASMSPEQRDQVRKLSEQLLDDVDLQWQLDQLQEHLQQLVPHAPWDRTYELSGADPLDFAGATEVFEQLGDIEQLENMLRSAANPGALAEVDLERARKLLGDDAAESLDRLASLTDQLRDAGLVDRTEGRLTLTAAGLRQIGRNALAEMFRDLQADRSGAHATTQVGVGHERRETTRPYAFGDPFNLDIQRTIRNALRRSQRGVPINLEPDDFEVVETEQSTRTSTVLMLDLSLSMPMRGNFVPAKKVAMALHALIGSMYPNDFLGIVGFSEVARVIRADELPAASWDYVYGTNMQHGLVLARQMLAGQRGAKQILMITDGEPTAHVNAAGDVVFHYPPLQATVDATLTEVARCTRADITLNSFVLDADPALEEFITAVARFNRGRAFFTNPEELGSFVLLDFLRNRRQTVRSR